MGKKFESADAINKDDRVYEVIKATERKDVVGVNVGGEHRFERNRFKVRDKGLAKEIHDTVGQGGSGEVMVIPKREKKEAGHSYTFAVPELPWHNKE